MRGGLKLEVDLESDSATVHELTAALTRLGSALRWMRRPRGGLGTALNGLAVASGKPVALEETSLPVRPVWTASSGR